MTPAAASSPSAPSLAQTDADIARCFPVIAQLRPHLAEAGFVARIRRQEKQNYRLAFSVDATDSVRCVAGFRVMEMLHSGRTLYVDDLVTDASARSQGFGDRMLDWLVAHARSLDCDEFSLDSGTQRVDAHRFYLRKRMKIASFHFSLRLKP